MTEPIRQSVYRRSTPLMGTVVTVDVVVPVAADSRDADAATVPLLHFASPPVEAAVERALDWFRQVEAICSRFEPESELARLSSTVGVAVPVSQILYEAVQFALAVAEETNGAFDPTIGAAMESRGFNRNYRTAREVRIAKTTRTTSAAGMGGFRRFFADPWTRGAASPRASFKDVLLDPQRRTITLLRPLVLDLGAVAKGLGIDLAARELRSFENFAINAGGDIYVSGHNAHGEPWRVGIRHPRIPNAVIDTLRLSNCAVCTSGDYERRCPPQSAACSRPASSDAAPAALSVGASRASVDIAHSPAANSPGERRNRSANNEAVSAGAVRDSETASSIDSAQHAPHRAAAAASDAMVADEHGGHHILDPRAGRSPHAAASATVIAPNAMLADALATAAFVLGPEPGVALLNRLGVPGIIFSPRLERHVTQDLASCSHEERAERDLHIANRSSDDVSSATSAA